MKRSVIKTVGYALVAVLTAGCAQFEENAARLGIKVERLPAPGAAPAATSNPSAAAAGASVARAAPAAPNPIRGTELDDIFKKNPITNSRRPETWPRVAIDIKAATPGIQAFSGQPLRPDDCVTFDIHLWRNAKDGKKFENLRMCTDAVSKEAEGKAFRTMNLLPRFTFHPGENTTAAQRTAGPTPPFYMFPQDIKSQQEWANNLGQGMFFLGAILLYLGYDWDNDFDRRVWVMNVPHSPPPKPR